MVPMTSSTTADALHMLTHTAPLLLKGCCEIDVIEWSEDEGMLIGEGMPLEGHTRAVTVCAAPRLTACTTWYDSLYCLLVWPHGAVATVCDQVGRLMSNVSH